MQRCYVFHGVHKQIYELDVRNLTFYLKCVLGFIFFNQPFNFILIEMVCGLEKFGIAPTRVDHPFCKKLKHIFAWQKPGKGPNAKAEIKL